jgi:hypothetical protein
MLALALPAIAQQAAQVPPQPATPPAVTPQPAPTPETPANSLSSAPDSDTGVSELNLDTLPPPPAPVEYPAYARRDPWVVGRLDPVQIGLGPDP